MVEVKWRVNNKSLLLLSLIQDINIVFMRDFSCFLSWLLCSTDIIPSFPPNSDVLPPTLGYLGEIISLFFKRPGNIYFSFSFESKYLKSLPCSKCLKYRTIWHGNVTKKHFSVALFSTLGSHSGKTLKILIFFFSVIEFIFSPFLTDEGCVLLGAISWVHLVWLCDFW